jgi:two-component system, chemotaxis family, chemotaxis protein CheY
MLNTVLIVDDNGYIRRLLCQLFMQAGFQICGQAENGKEAVAKAQQLCPDLIVTDLSMPVMNGLEETRLVKHLMPSVQVIIYTAYRDQFIEEEARKAGASALLSKSDVMSSLLETARNSLQNAA